MTRIKQTEIIPPHLIVAAKCYHQSGSKSRIRVPRMYTVSDKPDGRGMQVYLLTRYINHLGVAMSSILKVILPPSSAEADATSLGDGGSARKAAGAAGNMTTLEEVCREDRKHEEQMIMAWCTQMGGAECDPQNMI